MISLGLFVRFSSPCFLFPIFIKEPCAPGQTAIDEVKTRNYVNIVDILPKCVEPKRSDHMKSSSHVQAGVFFTTQLDICNIGHGMANANHGNVVDETPLVDAIKGMNLEEVKVLLENAAIAEKADKDGKTFLVALPGYFASL